MSLFYLSMLSLTEIFGDFKLKDYTQSNLSSDLSQGILGYGGVIYFLIKSLRGGNVMYVNGMWDGISGIIESIAAYILRGERLNTMNQYIGIGMISIGIYLLHSGGIAKTNLLKNNLLKKG